MPSDRFTTFITATSPSTVSGPPRSPKLSRPTNGIVTKSTVTPALTASTAATTWPPSFSAGCRSKRSSIAPTAVITTAAARIPCSSSLPGITTIAAIVAPAKIASPPSSGVPPGARPRPRAWSTAPVARAKRVVSGVSSAVAARAIAKAVSASSSSSTLRLYPPVRRPGAALSGARSDAQWGAAAQRIQVLPNSIHASTLPRRSRRS